MRPVHKKRVHVPDCARNMPNAVGIHVADKWLFDRFDAPDPRPQPGHTLFVDRAVFCIGSLVPIFELLICHLSFPRH
jgi:hypothetical protein